MELDKIIVTVFLLVSSVVMLIAYKQSGKPVRNGILVMGTGLLSLGAAYALGLGVPLNLYTLLASLVLGAPGVASLAVVNLLV